MAQRWQFCLSFSRRLHVLAAAKPSHFVASSSFSQAFYQTLSLPSHSQAQHVPFDFNFKINFDLDDPSLLQFIQLLKKDDDDHDCLLSLKPNIDLIRSAIWVLRDDLKPALRAFNLGYNDEKVCNLIIWVLGTHDKFHTAWSIVRDMRSSSLSTHQAMLIIIDRYKIIYPLYCNLHVHLRELLGFGLSR